MLYTLFGLYMMAQATSPMDTVEKIEGMHLTEAECVARAKPLADLLGGARCRPETENDPNSPDLPTQTKMLLPSGRVIEVNYYQGYWSYPYDLDDGDRELVEQWTGFVWSR